MYIELEAVFNIDGEKKDFEYSFDINDDAIFASSVKVKGSVINRAGIVCLNGEASYDIKTVCDLCAAPIERHIITPIEHILLNFIGNEEDCDKFIVVDNMRLNLDELVMEDIFLSMPMRYLCKDDCKGLCSFCGVDLNKGSCNCSKPTDSRWDMLKELF